MALLDLLNKFNENQTVLGISLLPSSERLMKMIVTLRNHDFDDNEQTIIHKKKRWKYFADVVWARLL